MSMTKVWNITDANGPGHLRMVLGRSVKPGRAVQVEEARLEKAHKVHRDKDASLLHIGPRPPAWYLAKKKPPRARVDARRVGPDGRVNTSEPQVAVAKGHERLPAEAIAEDSAGAVDAAAEPEHMTKPMTGEEVPETVEEASEEPTEGEDDSSWGDSSRRKRKRK